MLRLFKRTSVLKALSIRVFADHGAQSTIPRVGGDRGQRKDVFTEEKHALGGFLVIHGGAASDNEGNLESVFPRHLGKIPSRENEIKKKFVGRPYVGRAL